MSKTHVQRTLAYLRERNIVYSVASWYNSYDRKRHDLLGVLDYVAFFPQKDGRIRLTGVQVSGRSDFAAHVRKIESSKLAKLWIESGNDIFLIGWGQLKAGWSSRTKLWSGGDLPCFHSNLPISSKPLKTPKHLKPPDISLL